MAESLDDGEFWLPPQFLTDDDILMDMGKSNKRKEAFSSEAEAINRGLFPLEFSNGFGSFGHSSSDLSSPVESVIGSTETESDEEDLIVGLTRQMAHSTLEEDFSGNHKSKVRYVFGSPQSTLCRVGSGCGCRQFSSRVGANCQLRVSSPPGTWDLPYAAIGEVERIRMNEESYGFYNHNRGLLGPPKKPFPVSVPVKNPTTLVDVGLYNTHHQHHHEQSLSHQKLQASQFQHLKQQQAMRQPQGSSGWGGPQRQAKATTGLYQVGLSRINSRNPIRPLGLSPSAWPSLQQAHQLEQPQQQNGSGMRALFLGAPKKECSGTGVFLPRRVDTLPETRKKQACPTVLLPAKVVQALNLNFYDMGSPPPPRFESYGPDADASMRYRNGYQKRNHRPQQVMNHEIRLPQEWTF